MKIQSFFNQQLKSFRESFTLYPISWISALVFTLLGIVNGYKEIDSTNTFIEHFQYALTVGMLAGLCLPAIFYKRLPKPTHIFSHLIALITIGIAYGLISYVSPYSGELNHLRVAVLCASLILMAFVFVPDQNLPVHKWLSIALNAALVALVFALCTLLGLTIITEAVSTLFFKDNYSPLRYLIPIYISGLVLFATFMLRFPSVLAEKDEGLKKQTASHNQALKILTDFIIGPLTLTAMAILIIWNLPFFSKDNTFALSFAGSTFATVILVGLVLMIYIQDHTHPAARFYKKVFPILGMVLSLAYLVRTGRQIAKVGPIQDTYFSFSLALFALPACFLSKDEKNHRIIPALFTALIVFYVSPFVGYQALPDAIQAKRLEAVLSKNHYFDKDSEQALNLSPEDQDQVRTSVNALMWKDRTLLPDWFDSQWSDNLYFKKTFGFERDPELIGSLSDDSTYYAEVQRTPIHIKGYDYVIPYLSEAAPPIELEDGRILKLTYDYDSKDLRATLDGTVLIHENLTSKVADKLLLVHSDRSDLELTPDQVALKFETDRLGLLVHFNYLAWAKEGDQIEVKDLEFPTVYVRIP